LKQRVAGLEVESTLGFASSIVVVVGLEENHAERRDQAPLLLHRLHLQPLLEDWKRLLERPAVAVAVVAVVEQAG
jgi:hypothetical protein